LFFNLLPFFHRSNSHFFTYYCTYFLLIFLLEYSHLNVSEKSMFRLKNILKPFFFRYDCDGNESLDSHELSAVFVDLGRLWAVWYVMCHVYTLYFFASLLLLCPFPFLLVIQGLPFSRIPIPIPIPIFFIILLVSHALSLFSTVFSSNLPSCLYCPFADTPLNMTTP
jgi:hypothetical protein